jgi:penicillin-binding protein 1A
MHYMARSMKGVKEAPFEPPPGITMVPMGSETKDGKPAVEYIYSENVGNAVQGPSALREANKPSEEVKNQIF